MDSIKSREKPTRDDLMKLFGENWAHIRHMEYYRMWCVNIYAAVVASLALALGAGKLERYFGCAAVFLVLFTISNLLITLKIEAVIRKFVEANEIIRDHELEIPESIAPIRTREPPWNYIKFEWIFTGFFCLVLAGIAVLVALH